jgi:hypothetical protein
MTPTPATTTPTFTYDYPTFDNAVQSALNYCESIGYPYDTFNIHRGIVCAIYIHDPQDSPDQRGSKNDDLFNQNFAASQAKLPSHPLATLCVYYIYTSSQCLAEHTCDTPVPPGTVCPNEGMLKFVTFNEITVPAVTSQTMVSELWKYECSFYV